MQFDPITYAAAMGAHSADVATLNLLLDPGVTAPVLESFLRGTSHGLLGLSRVMDSGHAMAALGSNASAMAAIARSASARGAFLASAHAPAVLVEAAAAIGAFVSDADALNSIIADTVLCQTVMSNPESAKAVREQKVLTQVSVPKMTSNTTPSGRASMMGAVVNNMHPWHAFDKNDATAWSNAVAAGNGAGHYLAYSFPNEVFIHTATLKLSRYATGCKVQCSPDESGSSPSWVTVGSAALPSNNQLQTIVLQSTGRWKYWRVVFDGAVVGDSYYNVNECDFVGFA